MLARRVACFKDLAVLLRHAEIERTKKVTQLTPVRRVIIKKTETRHKTPENKLWQGCGDLGTPVHGWLRMENGTVWRFRLKLKMELAFVPLLGLHSKALKPGSPRAGRTPMFIAAVFTTAKGTKN